MLLSVLLPSFDLLPRVEPPSFDLELAPSLLIVIFLDFLDILDLLDFDLDFDLDFELLTLSFEITFDSTVLKFLSTDLDLVSCFLGVPLFEFYLVLKNIKEL